jgi:hypothetical protein
MDRQGPQQAWPLLHQSCAEDGSLRSFRQRSIGSLDDLYPSEALRGKDKLEGKDHADRGL